MFKRNTNSRLKAGLRTRTREITMTKEEIRLQQSRERRGGGGSRGGGGARPKASAPGGRFARTIALTELRGITYRTITPARRLIDGVKMASAESLIAINSFALRCQCGTDEIQY